MVAGGMHDLTAFRDKLISLVDLLPDESDKLMDQRPRFVHAVLVLANQDLPGELLKANYIKQLDPYWIQTKGTPLASPTQPTQLFNQQSLHLQTSTPTWSSNEVVRPGQKTTSSETSGICSGGEDISQSPPPACRKVPIHVQPATSPLPSQQVLSQTSSRTVEVSRAEEAGLLGRAVEHRIQQATRSPGQEIRRQDLRPGDVLTQETHIKSSYMRSHVEQTPFPSQDRQKITRYHSDAEDHPPHHPTFSNRHRDARPTTNLDDPIIREAIRILEASCQLLDETAHRIAAANYENQGRGLSRGTKESLSFRFPSEIRRHQDLRSGVCLPSQSFAAATTTTTTKLIKETLTSTNY